MKFQKASPWIKELFASLVEGIACEQRSMFSYPCAFVNGQMFSGVFGDSLIVRLDEIQRAELLLEPGTQIFDPMGGRPMREYVQLTDAMLEDEEALLAWIRKGFAFASSLPPKIPKARKKAAPRAPKAKAPLRKAR